MALPCRRCGGEKDGGERRWYCNACQPIAAAEKRARDDARGHAWSAAHPESQRASEAKWRASNPGVAKAAIRRWHQANPERSAENRRKWRAANPDRARALAHRRRARQLAAFVEDVVALVVLERDDGACGICGKDVDPAEFHVDHVVPLARGGEHSYRNVQVAHPRCNLRKSAQV